MVGQAEWVKHVEVLRKLRRWQLLGVVPIPFLSLADAQGSFRDLPAGSRLLTFWQNIPVVKDLNLMETKSHRKTKFRQSSDWEVHEF